MQINSSIQIFLNKVATSSGFLSALTISLAKFLPYITVALIFIFICLHRDFLRNKNPFSIFMLRIREIMTLLTGLLLAVLSSSILKDIILRPRPYLLLGNKINPLLFEGTYDSLPSGHATFFFALAMLVYFFHRKAGIVLFAIAVLISVGRVAAGIHSPLDILVGLAIGVISALIARKIFKTKSINY